MDNLWILTAFLWLASVGLGVCSCVLAVRAMRRSESARVAKLGRELAAAQTDIDDLYDRMKRTMARNAGRARREKEQDKPETARRDDESVAAWKERMRGLIREGRISHEP